ncbi:hypothetical protein [Paenibacillus methanolicus]|uniref:DUF1963 domain-containing protein n=1 Tax=Paenibacillus methanolicus TaxID=582686 RepID=A0A5S5CJ71_9BACL|nr:hypothetical protein [Paenibacillus methanolicus]TYP79846.1 hypothetical protein BCM02_101967 [Paenibacillus methanolicus]
MDEQERLDRARIRAYYFGDKPNADKAMRIAGVGHLSDPVEVDPYAGLSDPVDILITMMGRMPYRSAAHEVPYPLSRADLFKRLTPGAQTRMKQHAMRQLEQGDDAVAIEILVSLVCLCGASLADCLPALMQKDVYFPGILYRNAGSAVARCLVDDIELSGGYQGAKLAALAWTGTEEAVSAFRRWRAEASENEVWRVIELKTASHAAGWEITSEGERRDLFDMACFGLNEGMDAAKENDVVKLLAESDAVCPWCSGKLMTLLDLIPGSEKLGSLALETNRLRVATCMHCGCYEDLYMDISSTGDYCWYPGNRKPDDLPPRGDGDGAVAPATRFLSDRRRDAYEAADWTLGISVSQIGGFPSWVQDARYPACPTCRGTMKFVAQVDLGEFDRLAQGMFYTFSCGSCCRTATVYQQS